MPTYAVWATGPSTMVESPALGSWQGYLTDSMG